MSERVSPDEASELLVAAVERAIADGAKPASDREGVPPHNDVNLIWKARNVELSDDARQRYFDALKNIPELAQFVETKFAITAAASGTSIDFTALGLAILAQSIVTQDPKNVATRFIEFARSRSIQATGVFAVLNVTVQNEIKIGSTALKPLEALSPSSARGYAMHQDAFRSGMRSTAAFCTNFKFNPVFYDPDPKTDLMELTERSLGDLQDKLNESRLLLGVVGIFPVESMFWVQSDDPLYAIGIDDGWINNSTDRFLVTQHIDESLQRRIESLSATYYSIPEGTRRTRLRIPLEWLHRAKTEGSLLDKAIDLGISMEALLLHDLNDHAGLKFSIRNRGAWLLGNGTADRKAISDQIAKLYDLRSEAVHSGKFKKRVDRELLSKGMVLCADLIGAMISRSCNVDWQNLTYGGEVT